MSSLTYGETKQCSCGAGRGKKGIPCLRVIDKEVGWILPDFYTSPGIPDIRYEHLASNDKIVTNDFGKYSASICCYS